MKDFSKAKEQAETDIHYNGRSNCYWQEQFLNALEELERANKIIDRLL